MRGVIAVLSACFIAASAPALAQGKMSMRMLLDEGFEVKAMTQIDGILHFVLQKGIVAYRCYGTADCKRI